mmetsp:Transcript_28355/g.90939  ORF Transcript_28355/g.90939 Transcript_28355/m.90939 type:complete len:213 (+) Transcript_28355:458-1096(+)
MRTEEARSIACRWCGGRAASSGTEAARKRETASISLSVSLATRRWVGSSMSCHAPRRRTSSRRGSTSARVTLSVYTSLSSTISSWMSSSRMSSIVTMPATCSTPLRGCAAGISAPPPQPPFAPPPAAAGSAAAERVTSHMCARESCTCCSILSSRVDAREACSCCGRAQRASSAATGIWSWGSTRIRSLVKTRPTTVDRRTWYTGTRVKPDS